MQKQNPARKGFSGNPQKRRKIFAVLASVFAVALAGSMLAVYFTVINPSQSGDKQVKAEIVIPGDKIYSFKNSSSQFDGGKKGATLYDYLMYLKDNEGLVSEISADGFVNGFYGYNPDRSKEYFKIYVNGKASKYGVKTYKLKNGEKYSFIPEKTGTGKNYTSAAYPDFLKDRDYWLPTQGKKDITVKILFLDSVKTIKATTEEIYLSGLFEELTAAGKADIELYTDNEYGTGTSLNKVDGIKYQDNSHFWQVFAGNTEKWSKDCEENEIFNLAGGNSDWETGEPLLPAYVFADTFIFIKLTAAGSM